MNTFASPIPVAPIEPSTRLRIASWIAQIIAAIILVQTLYFKFTGAEESVHIFQAVGMEPWGRYGSGVTELIAAVLLLVPGTATLGAAISLGVISGALFFHLTKLGIVIHDDGGLLFGLAIVVFACSAFVLVVQRRTLPVVGRWF